VDYSPEANEHESRKSSALKCPKCAHRRYFREFDTAGPDRLSVWDSRWSLPFHSDHRSPESGLQHGPTGRRELSM